MRWSVVVGIDDDAQARKPQDGGHRMIVANNPKPWVIRELDDHALIANSYLIDAKQMANRYLINISSLRTQYCPPLQLCVRYPQFCRENVNSGRFDIRNERDVFRRWPRVAIVLDLYLYLSVSGEISAGELHANCTLCKLAAKST